MSKKGSKQARVQNQPRPAEPEQLIQNPRAADEDGGRKSSSGHKKVTADKWNQ